MRKNSPATAALGCATGRLRAGASRAGGSRREGRAARWRTRDIVLRTKTSATGARALPRCAHRATTEQLPSDASGRLRRPWTSSASSPRSLRSCPTRVTNGPAVARAGGGNPTTSSRVQPAPTPPGHALDGAPRREAGPSGETSFSLLLGDARPHLEKPPSSALETGADVPTYRARGAVKGNRSPSSAPLVGIAASESSDSPEALAGARTEAGGFYDEGFGELGRTERGVLAVILCGCCCSHYPASRAGRAGLGGVSVGCRFLRSSHGLRPAVRVCRSGWGRALPRRPRPLQADEQVRGVSASSARAARPEL